VLFLAADGESGDNTSASFERLFPRGKSELHKAAGFLVPTAAFLVTLKESEAWFALAAVDVLARTGAVLLADDFLAVDFFGNGFSGAAFWRI